MPANVKQSTERVEELVRNEKLPLMPAKEREALFLDSGMIKVKNLKEAATALKRLGFEKTADRLSSMPADRAKIANELVSGKWLGLANDSRSALAMGLDGGGIVLLGLENDNYPIVFPHELVHAASGSGKAAADRPGFTKGGDNTISALAFLDVTRKYDGLSGVEGKFEDPSNRYSVAEHFAETFADMGAIWLVAKDNVEIEKTARDLVKTRVVGLEARDDRIHASAESIVAAIPMLSSMSPENGKDFLSSIGSVTDATWRLSSTNLNDGKIVDESDKIPTIPRICLDDFRKRRSSKEQYQECIADAWERTMSGEPRRAFKK